MAQVSKYVQRRFYSFLNTQFGFAFAFIGFCLVIHALIGLFAFPCVDSVTSINLMGLLRGSDSRVFCAHTNYQDNIGQMDLELQMLAHEPIDIVYTWVNGSDPIWLAKKLEFMASATGDAQPDASLALHLNASNVTNATTEEEIDEASSDNRYRDSNELRYSLRSLVKYAPWIRNVYVVTDNQIPHWLNLENERLFMVSHSEIFPNTTHLPVFSSPAIESHLHMIPGLSRRFIYFNDDVFLGAPVTPEDFVSIGGVQKFTMAWDVPKCAPGCAESWIGDGYCDKACNVSACNFDFPDCLPKNESTLAATGARGSRGGPAVTLHCAPGCPESWLSDKVCDTKCKTPECGFDLGDCGIMHITDNYPGAALVSAYFAPSMKASSVSPAFADLRLSNLTSEQTVELMAPASAVRTINTTAIAAAAANSTGADSENSTAVAAADVGVGLPPVVLTVPFGSTHVVYFNISQIAYLSANAHDLFTTGGSDGPHRHETWKNLTDVMSDQDFVYSSAEFDNEQIVHVANVLTKHHLLAVILYRMDYPPNSGNSHPVTLEPPSAFPEDTTFTVRGFNQVTNVSVSASFVLRVTAPVSLETDNWMSKPEKWLRAMPSVPVLSARASSVEPDTDTDIDSDLRVVVSPFTPVSGYLSKCNAFAVTEGAGLVAHVSLLEKPFVDSDSSAGVVLLVETVSPDDPDVEHAAVEALLQTPAAALQLRSVFTFADGAVARVSMPLDAALSVVDRNGLVVPLPLGETESEGITLSARIAQSRAYHAAYSGSDFYTEDNGTYFAPQSKSAVAALADLLLSSPARDQVEGVANTHSVLLLRLPVPLHAASTPIRTWVHCQWDIVHSEASISAAAEPGGSDEAEDKSPAAVATEPAAAACGVISFKWGQWNQTASEEASRRRRERAEAAVAVAEAVVEAAAGSVDGNATAAANSVVNATATAAEPTVEAEATKSEADPAPEESQVRRRLRASAPGVTPAAIPGAYVSTGLAESIRHASAAATAAVKAAVSVQTPAAWLVHQLNLLPHSSAAPLAAAADTKEQERRRRLADSVDDWLRWLEEHQNDQQRQKGYEEEDLPSGSMVGGRRRLLADTYAQSLIHVNRMYNKEFGVENRKVPAHVPHMINREVMAEMQARWPQQWEATSTHRFRSPVDMQYSFAYYHYFMNRHKLLLRDAEEFIRRHVDTNNNELVDDNEFRTLVAVVKRGRVPLSPQDETEVRHNCSEERRILAGEAPLPPAKNGAAAATAPGYETSLFEGAHVGSFGSYHSVVAARRFPSVRELANCSLVRSAIADMDEWSPRPPNHVIGSEKDVAFEMIGDNATDTQRLLDSVRARLSKFICINDNIHHPSPELDAVVREFFLAMYPVPSAFELTSPAYESRARGGQGGGAVDIADERNPTLYTDEYRAKYASWRYHFRRKFYQMQYRLALARRSIKDVVRSLAVGLLRVVNEHEGQAMSPEEKLARQRRDAESNLVHGGQSQFQHQRRRLSASQVAEDGADAVPKVPFAHVLFGTIAGLFKSNVAGVEDEQLDLAASENIIWFGLLTAVLGLFACIFTGALRRVLSSSAKNKLAGFDSAEGASHQESYQVYQDKLNELDAEDSSSQINKRLALAAAREKAFSGSANSSANQSPVGPGGGGGGCGGGFGDGTTSSAPRVYADWNMKSNDFSQSEIEDSVQHGLEMARKHRRELQQEAEAEAAAGQQQDPLKDIWRKVGNSGRRASGTMLSHTPGAAGEVAADSAAGDSADPLNDIWKKAGYGLKQAGSSTGSASPVPAASPVVSPTVTPKGSSATLSDVPYSNSASYLSSASPPRQSAVATATEVPPAVVTQAEIDGALFLEHARRKRRIEEEDEAADRRAAGLAPIRSGILKEPTPPGTKDTHLGMSKGNGPTAKRLVGFRLLRNTVDGGPARPVMNAIGNMASFFSSKLHTKPKSK